MKTIHNAVKSQPRAKKKPKKLIRIAFSKKTTIILLLLIQFTLILLTFTTLSWMSTYVRIIFSMLSVFLGFVIINTNENPAYKLAWIVPLIAVPVFTSVLYLILNNQYSSRRLKTKYAKKCEETKKYLKTERTLLSDIAKEDRDFEKMVRYIDHYGGYPAYRNSEAVYLPFGETKFAVMLEELRKAKKFIFMEYFIIDDGKMWQAVVDILLEKVTQGVEVRLIYDGMGSQFTLPFRYKQKMAEKGIKTLVFNPFRPMISSVQNNRDHRKILVVDGNVGITGGVNIADEYINQKNRFGHWKDTAIMLKGAAVQSFTLMFLQMWNMTEEKPSWEECRLSFPADSSDGFVMPYCDAPLDGEKVGECVYMDMLYRSISYIHIMTPYLILDNELEAALKYAAMRGVEVKIILPGIPDKMSAYSLAKTHYKSLMKAGVKIYEYTPGFVHAKVFVSDDEKAVVGTINLDYRSLYHHFECATYLYRTSCISEIEQDFQQTLKKCRRVTKESVRNEKLSIKIRGRILKLFAPLM